MAEFFRRFESDGAFMNDEIGISQKAGYSVIPAKAGIQLFPPAISSLDSDFHRRYDFLRDHHEWLA
jgi:hypothetical protein